MGIESDRLVYDYLSRVGDLAQQRQLPASDRMKLVSGLRNEIDRRRATHGEESPAAVRGILGSLGTPDEVVDRAGPTAGGPMPKPRTGEGGGTGRRRGRRGEAASGASGSGVPGGGAVRPGATGSGAARPGASRPGASGPGASGPAIPAQDDRGPDGGAGSVAPAAPAAPGVGRASDWWHTDTEDTKDADDDFLGFVGGIERPDLFTPPEEDEAAEDEAAGAPVPGKRRRLARVLRRRKAEAPATEGSPEEEPEGAAPARARLANPFVLLAALLLLGGAVFGSLVALAAGWLLAYASRRLTPAEVKGAVLVIPGLSAATGILWLWGRVQGRWGEAVAPGGEAMGAAISETWPWVLRGAAIASALFLLWRSRKH
ncbi:hypothetical protein ACH4A8_25900 [Streptomyces vietnamensis]|uniref:hypothetical protein n=1 Tax=Streptomyces vietnamensis TaxID=362257 RepID=UPI0037B3EE4F